MPDSSKIPNQACCLGCNYALRDLQAPRCPECGRAFNPVDYRTMSLGRPLRRWAQPLLKPPSIAFNVVVAANAVLVCIAFSAPYAYAFLVFLSGAIWCLLGLIWGIRLCTCVLIAIHYRQPCFRHVRTWLRWGFGPASVALVALLLAAHVPLRAAFRASRPAMARVAEDALAGNAAPPAGSWLGVYCVNSVTVMTDEVYIVVRGAGFLSRGGFVYSPNGPPTGTYEDRYRPLRGDWYAWWVEF